MMRLNSLNMENLIDSQTKKQQASFIMPTWLIDRMKMIAIAQAFQTGKQIFWTDIARKVLAEKYPKINNGEVK